MRKGSKEAKAWGRKMKRLRAAKSKPKRRKSSTKRRKTTTKRKRRVSTMARRKRTYRRRSSGKKAFNMRNLLIGLGAGTAVATVAGNNPLLKGGAGFLMAGIPGAVGAVGMDFIGGNLNLGGAGGSQNW